MNLVGIRFLVLFSFVLFLGAWGAEARPKYIQLKPKDSSTKIDLLNKRDNKICPLMDGASIEENIAFQKCRRKNYKSLVERINVYGVPSLSSKLLGQIIVTITMEYGTSGKFMAKGIEKAMDPDSRGTDPGYDGYFEFTVSDVSGDWIQLPKRPFEKPVWINLKEDWGAARAPEVQYLGIGTVVDSPFGDVVTLDFTETEFVYRNEGSSSSGCGEESENESPAEESPEDLKEHRVPLKEIYDFDGHLLLWSKYTRGC